ncbi:MAG: arginine--tRNA ligase [Hyphomicrobiaceae bacterium]|nr:arginine--tRNA ligase [Hyphomicrobiaceae bacterium]
MNAFQQVGRMIAEALEGLRHDGALPPDMVLPPVEVETPRDPSHGDLASNAAMVLARPAKMKPRDIALALKARLEADQDVFAGIEVAGPGFLNLRMKPAFWQQLVREILVAGGDYGRGAVEGASSVNVEYVSANPTGPMHVGHCRNAVLGDALANLLAFAGYDVTREYYINDAGAQVDVLARSAYLRYREALGVDIGEIPEGLYPADYLKPVGAALAERHGEALVAMDEADWLPIVRDFAIDQMMVMIRDDLATLDVHHDIFFSERSLKAGDRDRIRETIEGLRGAGLVYEGHLPPPKGEPVEDWEDREQTLFRSTSFGDDVDRALYKSDGSHTYFAADIAYHADKLSRGYRQLINLLGADHSGYAKRIKAAVHALSDGAADLDVQFYQFVKLYKNGEPFKMSKRAGTFVTLRDVVDEVGRDAVRFMMLYRKNDAPIDFDFAKVTEQSKDNPVFYVQYAHARAASLFRNAEEAFSGLTRDSAEVRDADLSLIDDQGELDLIKRLAVFPKMIASAAEAHEPHRLAFYLYDLASMLHGQWSRGNDSPHLRFIRQEDRGTTAARLALVAATQRVISSGLDILGVEAPEAMR